jgi:hypothetical protein
MALMQGSLQQVIDILIENRENDFFNCVAITGKVRKGKSTLAYYIVKGTYPEFTYEANYLGNPKHGESFRTLMNTPKKSSSWLDEGEKVLSAERRLDKDQWWLQQLFNQFASHNKTIVICTPTFRRIDSRWRDAHISIWIHIYRRGAAVLLRNRDIQSSSDVWGLGAMKETELSMRADQFSDERILKSFDANPCALFYFTFPDWESEEVHKDYLTHKEESQKDLAAEFDEYEKAKKMTNVAKMANMRLLGYLYWKYTLNISFQELGALCGLSGEGVRQLVIEFYDKVYKGEINSATLPARFTDEFFTFARGSWEKNNMV